MIREFVDLVNEAVDTGYNKGINLFMENLEEDLKNNPINEGKTSDDQVKELFLNEGYALDEDMDNIDEDKINAALENIDED